MKKLKLGRYVEDATNALGSGSKWIGVFSVKYFWATHFYGNDAKEAFKHAFPFFGEREWTRFGLIGGGKLDPLFAFKSDAFIGKLIKMKDPLKVQADICRAAYDESASPHERETNVAGIVRTVNKSRSGKKRRGSREILNEVIEAVVALEARRDDEWDFVDKHGYDPAYWSSEAEDVHKEILDDINELRAKLEKLFFEATGKETLV